MSQAPPPGGKSRIVAALLAIFLGWLGVHKFYLGFTTPGLIMLGASILLFFTCFVIGVPSSWLVGIVGIIEGIIYLTKTDEQFYQTYVVEKKQWF